MREEDDRRLNGQARSQRDGAGAMRGRRRQRCRRRRGHADDVADSMGVSEHVMIQLRHAEEKSSRREEQRDTDTTEQVGTSLNQQEMRARRAGVRHQERGDRETSNRQLNRQKPERATEEKTAEQTGTRAHSRERDREHSSLKGQLDAKDANWTRPIMIGKRRRRGHNGRHMTPTRDQTSVSVCVYQRERERA